MSFATDVQPIFDANCIGCHSSTGSASWMDLTSGSAYDAIVDVPSNGSALDRVEPGSAADSYLYHKTADTQDTVGGSGNPMPPSAGGLDATSLQTLGDWIDDGAAP